MIPVLGIPYISRSDLFIETVTSINHPVNELVIIDNSNDGSCPQVDGARYLKMHRNMGVSWAWNTIIKNTREAAWWAISNADLRYGPDDLKRLDETMSGGVDLALVESMALFGISPRCIQTVGWFDENFVPSYCLHPETPVLTADLRWRPIGDLSIGDHLVGVDEYPGPRQRRMRMSEVTETGMRQAACVLIRLEDGREVTCTKDHRWLAKTKLGGMPWQWRAAGGLLPGHRLQVGLDTWSDATDYGSGWLAGILDGEGCLHHTDRMTGINISQKEGVVLDRIRHELERLGIPFTWRLRKSVEGREPVAMIEISSRRKAMELIGRLRPQRLLRPELWEGRALRSRMYPTDVRIVEIEEAGDQWVSTIETTTHTYIANGITSHNCEDNDYIYRARLMGIEPVFIEPQFLHHGSMTIKSDPKRRAGNDRSYPMNVKYYERKWGGQMHREVFKTPFDKGGSPRDVPTLDFDRYRALSWD